MLASQLYARPPILHGPHLHASRPSRKVLCRAKGKKGQQRNEGLYFKYRDVEEQPAVPERKAKPGEFSWVQQARGSIRQYEKVKKQGPKRSSGQQKQQQQKQQDGSPAPAAGPATVPPKAAAPPAAAAAAATAPQQPLTGTSTASAAATSAHPTSPAVTTSSKEHALQRRKQQLLQRMKGAAGAGAAAAAAGTGASSTQPPTSAAAGAPAGTAVDAEAQLTAEAAAAAVPELRAFELDDETDQLLQELIDMAAELSEAPGGMGLSSLVDNDPLADPLAALNLDESEGFDGLGAVAASDSSTISSGSRNASRDGSNGLEADEEDEATKAMTAFAAELAAAKAVMQQFQAGISTSSSSSSSVSQQHREQQEGEDEYVRTADLLAWEAEQARQVAVKLTVTDRQISSMESALLAVQQEELRDDADAEGAGDMLDDFDDTIFGDYDGDDDADLALDDADDLSFNWINQDPQLLRLLQANDAEFAQLLSQADEDGENSSNTVQQEEDSWAGLGVQDWVEAAEASPSDACSSSSGSSSSGGLSDVMDAIDSDPTLDEAGRVEAKMRIAGVLNLDQGAAAAAAAAAAVAKSSGSGAARQASAPAGAAVDGGDAVPVLLPRPVRPKQP